MRPVRLTEAMKLRPKIKITLVDKKGSPQCHHGHRPGDSFDYDTERGKLCPIAMHAAFPYIDILRYDGEPPRSECGEIRFCCPASDVINIFKIEREQTND